MICIRCGHVNPPRLNHCNRCNASLPRLAFEEGDGGSSAFDVEEGRQYLVPQRSYPTEHLYNLTCRAHEYIHQGASGTPLLEAYEIVRSRMLAFEADELPELLETLQVDKTTDTDEDYYHQMIYLLTRGMGQFHEGFALMDAFVGSGDVETLKQAIVCMQQSNDHLALAREVSFERAGVPTGLAPIPDAPAFAEGAVSDPCEPSSSHPGGAQESSSEPQDREGGTTAEPPGSDGTPPPQAPPSRRRIFRPEASPAPSAQPAPATPPPSSSTPPATPSRRRIKH